MTPTQSALIGVLGTILVAVVGYMGVRYTARKAREAAQMTRDLEERKLDVTTWREQVDSWRKDAEALREMRAQDRRDFEAEMDKMNGRLGQMEDALARVRRERQEEQAQMSALIIWARNLVALVRQNGLTYPPPPVPGITDTDPGTRRAGRRGGGG